MQKIICGRVYDTEESSVVKKVTSGCFGDPAGYEETLYVTDAGSYFFYTNGGAESRYPVENIRRASKGVAEEWLKANG